MTTLRTAATGRALGLTLALALASACAFATPAFARGEGERALKEGIASADADKIVSGLVALGDENDERAAKTILNVALAADSLNKGFKPADTNKIFEAAKRALAGMTDEKAQKFVFKSVERHRDPRVRIILLEVCGAKADPDAEAAVVEALKDKDPTVSGTAARILGAKRKLANPQAVVEGMINLLDEVESDRRAPWQDVLQGLVQLTGEEIDNAGDWSGWWKVKGDTWTPSETRTERGVSDTVRRNAPKLFGKEILSKRLVFILDVSGSMALKDPIDEQGRKGKWVDEDDPDYHKIPAERMRMERLKKAMVAALKDLPEDTRFTIVTFATDARIWNEKLIPANAENRAKAIKFTNSMNPQGFTWTDTALERAFEIPEANSFYLFSDGVPQRAKGEYISPDEICEKVEQLNRTRKVRIYTIGLGEADQSFMGRLARENGGDFTPVD